MATQEKKAWVPVLFVAVLVIAAVIYVVSFFR
jgi:hypothetical protein